MDIYQKILCKEAVYCLRFLSYVYLLYRSCITYYYKITQLLFYSLFRQVISSHQQNCCFQFLAFLIVFLSIFIRLLLKMIIYLFSIEPLKVFRLHVLSSFLHTEFLFGTVWHSTGCSRCNWQNSILDFLRKNSAFQINVPQSKS